jgi:pilus assembly protein CpaD
MSTRMIQPSLRLLAVLALGAAVSACATRPAPDAVADARTPTEQFVPRVVASPEEIRLAVHPDGVSANQAAALAAFADAWREAEGGAVSIQAPAGPGPDSGAVGRATESARARLLAAGVPAQMIQVVGYDAGGAANAPLVVGFLRHQVDLPRCGETWTNIARSASNAPQPNFGCAVTANMAAQIANPSDLVAARPMDPSDAGRRSVVLDKYRKGEVTASQVDENAGGAVSQAVR